MRIDDDDDDDDGGCHLKQLPIAGYPCVYLLPLFYNWRALPKPDSQIDKLEPGTLGIPSSGGASSPKDPSLTGLKVFVDA